MCICFLIYDFFFSYNLNLCIDIFYRFNLVSLGGVVFYSKSHSTPCYRPPD